MPMSQYMMQYTWFLIIIFCIDQGDGRWRERDRDTLRHDIELYRKIAEKIEHEIEAFYDENPEEPLTVDRADKTQHKYVTTGLSVNGQSEPVEHSSEKRNFTYIVSDIRKPHKYAVALPSNYLSDSNATPLEWPKFEDILLQMGKKYDWKNDKWIKIVKRKAKVNVDNKSKSKKLDNSSEIHEKHKFKYRIVKLKNKNRRSVVVAVSAVR